MTPINLEDVESYQIDRAIDLYDGEKRTEVLKFVRQTHTELRAREAAAQDRFSALREEAKAHAK